MMENLQNKIDTAFSFHQKGDLKKAKELYLSILEETPDNANVLNLVGMIYLKEKNVTQAIEYLEKSSKLLDNEYVLENLAQAYSENKEYKKAAMSLVKSIEKSPTAEKFFLLAAIFKEAQSPEDAVTAYQTAIEINPEFYNAYFNLGNLYKELQQWDLAYNTMQTAYNLNENDTDLIKNIGEVAYKLKKYNQAEIFFRKAYEVNNKDSYAGYNLANVLKAKKCYPEAINILQKLTSSDNSIDILICLADILQLSGRTEEAISVLKQAETREEKKEVIFNNLAVFLSNSNQVEEAINYYQKIIQLNPDSLEAYNGLGLCSFIQNNLTNTENYYKKVLEKNPEYVNTLYNFGVLEKYKHNPNKARDYFKKVLEISPDYTEAKVSLGMIDLTEKKFAEGFKNYFYKQEKKKALMPSEYVDSKIWNKEDLTQKTIIVESDGGHGDTIMFSRYLPFLKEKAEKVILRTHENLYQLMKENFSNIDIIAKSEILPNFDYFTYIMHLPYMLDMDFDNIPSNIPYIKANNKLCQKFKQKFFNNDLTKIGIFWQGNTLGMKNRAIKLEKLSPLKTVPSAQIYSLQKGYGTEQLDFIPKDFNIIDLQNEINNFSDTAAIIDNLDIVISIDSVIANLGGAMGKKTFLMLPHTPEWRWFSDDKKTPWYKNTTIFKQKEFYNWDTVVDEIVQELT